MAMDNSPWSDPSADLSPEDYEKVCLVDLNDKGQMNKAMMKLPLKKTPDSSYNRNAVHAAAGALAGARGGVKGLSPDQKKAAARKLITIYKSMDELAPEAIYRIAGEKRPNEKKPS